MFAQALGSKSRCAPIICYMAMTDLEEKIIILGFDPGQDVLLHSSVFSNMTLFVNLKDWQIVVRQGRNPESGILYTYIALSFDKAYIKIICGTKGTRMAVTRWDHHITLAYLPWRAEQQMRDMAKSMRRLLVAWSDLEPSLRPLELLTSRSFTIGRHKCDFDQHRPPPFEWDRWGDSDIYDYCKSDFLQEDWEQIERLLDEGLLDFEIEPKKIAEKRKIEGDVSPQFVKEVCWEYWYRDCNRYFHAEEIERLSRPKHNEEGSVEILLREGRVSECSEVRSLLHYLRELLVFKFGAFHMTPGNDVELLSENKWHVTPQTRRLLAERDSSDMPEHADYVECHWPVLSSA